MSMFRMPRCGADCAARPNAAGTGVHGSHETSMRRIPCRALSAAYSSIVRLRENASNFATACGAAPMLRAQSSTCHGST